MKLLETIHGWIIGQYQDECKIRWNMEEIKEREQREQRAQRKVVICKPYELSKETKETSSIDADLAARIKIEEFFEKQIKFFGSSLFMYSFLAISLITFSIFIIL